MDEVNNVSDPYYLIDINSPNNEYWISENAPQTVTITDNSTHSVPAFDEETSQYVLKVSLDSGTAIKKISAKDAVVSAVEFNDYTGGTQPTYNTSGDNKYYFNDKTPWINVSSLKITLNNVTKGWKEKNVKLMINDESYDVFTIGPKKLTASDIELSPTNWTSGTTTYLVPITLKNDAPIDMLVGQTLTTTASGATVELDTGDDGQPKQTDGKYRFKITGDLLIFSGFKIGQRGAFVTLFETRSERQKNQVSQRR